MNTPFKIDNLNVQIKHIFGRINWWNANAFWCALSVVPAWIVNAAHIRSMLPYLLATSFVLLLVSFGFWKKSISVLYIILLLSIISVAQVFLAILQNKFIFSVAFAYSTISYLLIAGLSWKVLVQERLCNAAKVRP
ncbi:MAG: hypothetical protein WCO78_04175 [Candidatus Roizmanbacteria bacterium]